MERVELEDLRRAFGRWRASKRHVAEPVPEELWDRAVEAARVHGRTKAAQRLGVNHSALKQRMERPGPRQEFVELPVGLVSSPESRVEVEDVTGLRLRLVLPGAKPHEVAAAAREIWSRRR